MQVRYQAALRPECTNYTRAAKSAPQRGIEGQCKFANDLVYVLPADDIGRGQQYVVATFAVDGASHRVTHEAVRHCLAFDDLVHPARGFEW